MEAKMLLSKQWILLGASAGIIATLLFPILLLAPLPDYLEIFLAATYGILFSLTGFAIHHLMKYHQPTVLTAVGGLFIFAAGFLFNIMLTIQLTFKGYLYHYRDQVSDPADLNLLDWIAKTVDPVHLGLQISNDFFTAFAMLCFSVAMWSHPFFGKGWSISSALIAIALLVSKCYAFPMTPYELGFPFILGPIIALWFLLVYVQCWRKRGRLAESE